MQLSQNNRAFRSNPNCVFCDAQKKINCHKITEPSAQIPTKERKPMSFTTLWALSQNNRAFRSNPNLIFFGGLLFIGLVTK